MFNGYIPAASVSEEDVIRLARELTHLCIRPAAIKIGTSVERLRKLTEPLGITFKKYRDDSELIIAAKTMRGLTIAQAAKLLGTKHSRLSRVCRENGIKMRSCSYSNPFEKYLAKQCTSCLELKYFTEFKQNEEHSSGYASHCRRCMSKKQA